MTEVIEQITAEIDNSITPETLEVEFDEETGRLTEFHRETVEKI
jgi:hypothetical protein